MLKAELNRSDVARTFRVLKKLEPDMYKQMNRDLKERLIPVANKVASAWGNDYPSGIANAMPSWKFRPTKPSMTRSFTPGRSKRNANRMVSLVVKSQGASINAFEFMGLRTKGKTFSGKALYNWVTSRYPAWPNGGRIFYKAFLGQRWNIFQASSKIINDFCKQFQDGV